MKASPPTVRSICVIMAMEPEARPIIEALDLSPDPNLFPPGLPQRVFRSPQADTTTTLVLNGKDPWTGVDSVATQPASLSAYLAMHLLKPDLVINAGTAGGFGEQGATIGRVYLAYPRICYHDRRIPIPGFDAYGLGSYPTPECVDLARTLGFHAGIVSTGNSLDHTDRDLEVMRETGAVVKDMEAAAVAWVGRLLQVPVLVLKAITDVIDATRPVEQEFLENLALASTNLRDALLKLLTACFGMPCENFAPPAT